MESFDGNCSYGQAVCGIGNTMQISRIEISRAYAKCLTTAGGDIYRARELACDKLDVLTETAANLNEQGRHETNDLQRKLETYEAVRRQMDAQVEGLMNQID